MLPKPFRTYWKWWVRISYLSVRDEWYPPLPALKKASACRAFKGCLNCSWPASRAFMAVKASKRMGVPLAVGSIFQLNRQQLPCRIKLALLFINLEKVVRYTDSIQVLKEILFCGGTAANRKHCGSRSNLGSSPGDAGRCKQFVRKPRVYAQMIYGTASDADLSVVVKNGCWPMPAMMWWNKFPDQRSWFALL